MWGEVTKIRHITTILVFLLVSFPAHPSEDTLFPHISADNKFEAIYIYEILKLHSKNRFNVVLDNKTISNLIIVRRKGIINDCKLNKALSNIGINETSSIFEECLSGFACYVRKVNAKSNSWVIVISQIGDLDEFAEITCLSDAISEAVNLLEEK
ncbi:MAG: hypothetical protein OXR62_00520 [Ahrensia sp.]|nr:hypothetical protein [Ahrensia sp.]